MLDHQLWVLVKDARCPGGLWNCVVMIWGPGSVGEGIPWGWTQSWAGKAFHFLGSLCYICRLRAELCRVNSSVMIMVHQTVFRVRTPTSPWSQIFYLNVNKMAALSKGTFLIPETGNEARHLYICFQRDWFLGCKYLTIHHSSLTRVSVWFSVNSISHRQIKKKCPHFPDPF